MSRHSFDPEVAEKVGLNAAVIYQNIVWWCEKNAANERNIHDGKAWTFNSMKAFERLFPYLTSKQIRVALEKLEEVSLIESGNFNEKQYDRTKWYCPTGQMEMPLRANGNAPEGKPIPDSKPVDKPDTPQPPMGEPALFSAMEEPDSQEDPVESGFDTFWKEIWPSHFRKAGKVDCRKLYRKACEGKHPKADERLTPEQLNAAARRYIASVDDRQYLKAPKAWLNGALWEPWMDAPDSERARRNENWMERVQ